MDTFTIAIIVVLILALLFFGFVILSDNSRSTGASSSNYPSGQYVGGGCGR